MSLSFVLIVKKKLDRHGIYFKFLVTYFKYICLLDYLVVQAFSPFDNCFDSAGVCIACYHRFLKINELSGVCDYSTWKFAIINTTERLDEIGQDCYGSKDVLHLIDVKKINRTFVWNYDKTPLNRQLWAAQFPTSVGDCVVFDTTVKRLKNVDCKKDYPSLCTYQGFIEETTSITNFSECVMYCFRGNVCLSANESCEDGCQEGYYTDQCLKECPTSCKSGKCEQFSGLCYKDCSDYDSDDFECEVGGETTDDNLFFFVLALPVVNVVLVALICILYRRRKTYFANGEDAHGNNNDD
ncbi:hypothetical protein Bpfe_001257 [Biomphalaria pfeifferi]|uniref:C-type lectin domain-containing protein n=1 Tax=Biomphalaria pfeifferi TaxID=112525 RepID=A0AAD8CBM4_BIOPF|nr:hypothetical protein Bpfe_001257 [Biomphalaria pfeifferi]